MTARYDARGRSTRTAETATDYFAALRDRVTVQGDCFVLDGRPDAYGIYKGQKAHRAIWQAVNGPITKGYDVHHTCEVKGCINPQHLVSIPACTHQHVHKGIPDL